MPMPTSGKYQIRVTPEEWELLERITRKLPRPGGVLSMNYAILRACREWEIGICCPRATRKQNNSR